MQATNPAPSAGAAIWLAVLLTVAAGVAMRWALAGEIAMPWDFVRLRHAHAHLGYYGVLIPFAWLAWARSGIPLPTPRLAIAYAVAVAVSIFGFLRAGYAPEAIVGSTVVGGVWLVTAWSTRHRMGTWNDPLGGLFPGMTLALVCVPFVALHTRTTPVLAQAWVATFLSALLLLVVVPTVLGALRIRRPWAALVFCGAAGAAALGVWPSAVSRLGLGLFGVLVLPVRWGDGAPLHVRVVWAALGSGLMAMAAGWVPHSAPVVIGAVHFIALSVCIPALAVPFGIPLRSPWWWLHHAAVLLLSVPIALQAFGAGPWTWNAAAWGGTVVLAEVIAVLAATAPDGSR